VTLPTMLKMDLNTKHLGRASELPFMVGRRPTMSNKRWKVTKKCMQKKSHSVYREVRKIIQLQND
jgi:hypothetical protein